jgi:GNAT superfamily N-acetyltransferase
VPRSTSWIARLWATFGDRLQRGGYEYFSFTSARIDWIRRWPERIPRGMQLVPMDVELARRAEQERTLQVATAQTWGSFERFVERGFGFVVLARNGELAGAISTFGLGEGEAEIDIATRKDYRRQGLATLRVARLSRTVWRMISHHRGPRTPATTGRRLRLGSWGLWSGSCCPVFPLTKGPREPVSAEHRLYPHR